MNAWKTAILFLFACSPAFAVMHQEEIVYRDGEQILKGQLFWDDAFSGKRPGVMVVHEWWGLNDFAKLRAEMLAEMGYVAFAADLYGEGRKTRKPDQAGAWRDQLVADPQAWLARASLGLAQLAAHPNVDADRLAAIGYSLGGATVIRLGLSDAAPLGVVSVYGPLDWPAQQLSASGAGSSRVLLLQGGADAFVPTEREPAFTAELAARGVDWELTRYGGAMHGFANPYADSYGITGLAYQEAADQRSWSRILDFLRDLFGESI